MWLYFDVSLLICYAGLKTGLVWHLTMLVHMQTKNSSFIRIPTVPSNTAQSKSNSIYRSAWQVLLCSINVSLWQKMVFTCIFVDLICFFFRVVTFTSVHHLTLHFPSNFGGEQTKIYYIGMQGEFSEANRHGVTICTYESRPNIFDHQNPMEDHVLHKYA